MNEKSYILKKSCPNFAVCKGKGNLKDGRIKTNGRHWVSRSCPKNSSLSIRHSSVHKQFANINAKHPCHDIQDSQEKKIFFLEQTIIGLKTNANFQIVSFIVAVVTDISNLKLLKILIILFYF